MRAGETGTLRYPASGNTYHYTVIRYHQGSAMFECLDINTLNIGFIAEIDLISGTAIWIVDPPATARSSYGIQGWYSLPPIGQPGMGSLRITCPPTPTYTPQLQPKHEGHEIVETQALGKKFYYCRHCKIEVDKP